MGDERPQETNSEGCKKIMTEKKSLGGGKKVEGAGTNLYRSEGPEGRRQERFGRHLRLEKMPTETGLSKRRQTLVETLEWNRAPKGGRTDLNRPWDPVP